VVTFENVLEEGVCRPTRNVIGTHNFTWEDVATHFTSLDNGEKIPLECSFMYNFAWTGREDCETLFDRSGDPAYRTVSSDLDVSVGTKKGLEMFVSSTFLDLGTNELRIHCKSDLYEPFVLVEDRRTFAHIQQGNWVFLRTGSAFVFKVAGRLRISQYFFGEVLLEGVTPEVWGDPIRIFETPPYVDEEDASMLNFSSVCANVVPPTPYQCVRVQKNDVMSSLMLAATASGTAWAMTLVLGQFYWKRLLKKRTETATVAPEEMEDKPPLKPNLPATSFINRGT